MQGEIRTEWIATISGYQEHDFYGYFIICEHHFKTKDFCEENGKKVLRKGVIPSVFPEPQSLENHGWSDCELGNTDFHEHAEYSNEDNGPVLEDISVIEAELDVEKDSNILCHECINLNMHLMRAKKKISMLQKKLLAQKETIDKYKKELNRMHKEEEHLKTDSMVR